MSSTTSTPARKSIRSRLKNARNKLAAEDRFLIGQLAVEQGFLQADELQHLLQRQRKDKLPIGELLVKHGYVSAQQFVELLREQRRRNLLNLFDDWSAGAPESVMKLITDPSRHLGDYILVDKVGSGGTGDVWKAWDQKIRRWVAVKILRHETGPQVRRFLREAYAAGRLRHPNIISVHKAAEQDGRPFLVMDFIEGASLETRFIEPEEAARLMIIVARAMDYAHQRGVIHRDLKPANLLLDPSGNILITDFGLALLTDVSTLEGRLSSKLKTVTGAVMGTPAYMPPEQALGKNQGNDPRGDVYSLGATLYRLVTGEAPFQGKTPAEIILNVIDEEPEPPRKIMPRIPRTLESIILKCLRKEPDQRYASMDDLAQDLERYLNGEPVRARTTSAFIRVATTFRRSRMRLSAAVIFGIVAALGSVALMGIFGGGNTPVAEEKADVRAEARTLYGRAKEIVDNNRLGWNRLPDDPFSRKPADKALALIDEAVALDAEWGPPHVLKARLLRVLGRTEAALLEVEEGLRLAPKFRDGHLERGLFWLSEYRERFSLPEVEIDEAGPSRLIHRNQGSELIRRTIQDLDKAEGADKDDLLLARAYVSLYQEDYSLARARFHDLHKSGRYPDEAAEGMGLTCYQLADYDGAIEWFGEAILYKPRTGMYYLHRASVRWSRLRRGDERVADSALALEDLKRAERFGANAAFVCLMRGLVRDSLIEHRHRKGDVITEGELAEALNEYNQSLEHAPRYMAALSCRAALKHRVGRLQWLRGKDPDTWLQGSLRDYSDALKIHPGSPAILIRRARTWETIAEVREDKGGNPGMEYDNALNDYQDALKVDRTNASAILGLAEVRVHLAEIVGKESGVLEAGRKAVADCTELMKRFPDNPDIFITRARARRSIARVSDKDARVDEYRLAVADYQSAKRLLKDPWRVNISLAITQFRLAQHVPDPADRSVAFRDAGTTFLEIGSIVDDSPTLLRLRLIIACERAEFMKTRGADFRSLAMQAIRDGESLSRMLPDDKRTRELNERASALLNP